MIIDAHSHFINHNVAKDLMKNPEKSKLIENPSIDEARKFWFDACERHEIDKVIFMGLSSSNEEFTRFIKSSDKFVGITNVNPAEDDAVKKLNKDIENGYKGLKLYPTARAFDVGDEKVYKVYDYCKNKKIPVVIHFGVSIGEKTDLRYGNPINLSPVVRDYPEVNFVIAHFGAGYLKEALMLMYKRENILFDTSGTNNWLDFSPFGWNLKDVFKSALKAIGSERIIFGTDTRKYSEGYRAYILELQSKIVDELVSKKEKENIFYNNAKKIFSI